MLLGNLIYASLLGAAGAISFFLAIYAVRRRAVAGAGWFAVMMLACAVWSITGIGESLVAGLDTKIIWSQFSYLGIVSLPVAWFFFAVRFSGRDKWLKPSNLWLFWLIPAVTLLVVATNQWHHWLWSEITPISSVAGSPVIYTYGWWIWIHIGYSYILTLLGLVWLIRTSQRSKGLLHRQTQLLIVAGCVPLIGNALYVFKLNPWPPYDLGPVMFVITGIMVSWAIFRWQLLDIIPVAEKTLFAQMADGEIILDSQNRISAINQSAKKILGVNFIPLGSDGETWLRRLGLSPAFYQQEKTDQAKIQYQNYYLQITVNPFLRLGDQLAGRIITLRDISAQRKAEISRAEEGKKFQNVFNLAQDAMFIHSPEGNFIEVNQSACHRLGYSRDELMKMKPQDIDSPEYAKNVPGKIAELKKTGSSIFRTVHIAKNGHKIPTELSSKIIDWEGQPVILSVARDITERQKMEEEIKLAKERLAEAGRIARVGGWELDVATGRQNWTDEVYEIHELDKSFKPTAENGINFYAPEAKPIITRAVELAIKDGTPFDLELSLITAKGRKIFVRAIGKAKRQNGKIIKLTGIFQDITDLILNRRLLDQQGQELSMILDAIPALVFYKDSNNRFIRVNRALADSLKKSREQLEGKDLKSIYGEEVAGKYWLADQQVIKSGRPQLNILESMPTPDGLKWFHTDKLPYRDDRGRVKGIIGISLDITELKTTQEKMKKQLIELEKFNRLMVDRELRMVQLKKEIERLKQK